MVGVTTIDEAVQRCQGDKDASELDISTNDLSDDISGLVTCMKLEKLMMNECGVKTLETLTPLAKLANLQSLSISKCPVEDVENFKKKCFALLPNLVCIGECNMSMSDATGDENGNGGKLAAENGDNDVDEDDDEEEDDDDDESDEEIGIEALQKSGDLDDEDEEDYNPDEAELDEGDEDFDDDEEDNDVDEEDTGANLSGAGVTGPRRPMSKRRHEDDNADNGVTAAKVPATDVVEENVTNGAAAK